MSPLFRDRANAATILFVKAAPAQTDRSYSLPLRGARPESRDDAH